MVGTDDDYCFVGMLLIEFVSHAYSFVKVEDFVDAVAYVVTVSSVVNHSTFDLEEEAVCALTREEVDASTHDLLKR